MSNVTDTIKEVSAEVYLTVDVDCPYCDASLDIRSDIGEAWLPNRLDIPKCEIEITCKECKEEFLVTRVDY